MRISSFKHHLRALVCATSLLALVSAASAQTIDTDPQAKTEVLEKIADLLNEHAYVPTVDFSRWPDFVAQEKPKLDAAKNDDDFARALNEALSKFSASHIYLATPRAADNMRNASMVGIGITQQTVPDGVQVVRTVPGAPAAEAGIVSGDIIVKVDGQKADGIKGIPGKDGTEVTLTVRHKDGKEQDYTLVRRKFSTVRPAELTEVAHDTVKLSIYTFDWTYNRDSIEDLMRKADAYPNLILDLRDNRGGAVVNLQHLLGMLLPEDAPIGTFVNKPMVNAYLKAFPNGKASDVIKIADWSRTHEEWDFQQIRPLQSRDVPRYHGHVAVLINGFSGSASEMCAAALHDEIGATLIGQKSAGAVLVSVIVPATNRFTLQYPIMDYVTIKGVRLEGTGVTPEVVVEENKSRLPDQTDPVVEKAQELFARDKNQDDKGIGLVLAR